GAGVVAVPDLEELRLGVVPQPDASRRQATHFSWHRSHLRGVSPASVTLEDLSPPGSTEGVHDGDGIAHLGRVCRTRAAWSPGRADPSLPDCSPRKLALLLAACRLGRGAYFCYWRIYFPARPRRVLCRSPKAPRVLRQLPAGWNHVFGASSCAGIGGYCRGAERRKIGDLGCTSFFPPCLQSRASHCAPYSRVS